jgi:hypothetical protein
MPLKNQTAGTEVGVGVKVVVGADAVAADDLLHHRRLFSLCLEGPSTSIPTSSPSATSSSESNLSRDAITSSSLPLASWFVAPTPIHPPLTAACGGGGLWCCKAGERKKQGFCGKRDRGGLVL